MPIIRHQTTAMTRLEMTKLCYEFMGWNHQGYETWLNPGQAMEITHKMRLSVLAAPPDRWIVHGHRGLAFTEAQGNPSNSILECAAKILASQ